jgi:hypothetical protein
MAKYHSAPFKEGEIFFYPNLGALANFEDFTGQGISDAFSGQAIPKIDLIYALLHECHKVACLRKSTFLGKLLYGIRVAKHKLNQF